MDEFELAFKGAVEALAAALKDYETAPYDHEYAHQTDLAMGELAKQHSEDPAVEALLLVVERALDEDGFLFIPAARVLCEAVKKDRGF